MSCEELLLVKLTITIFVKSAMFTSAVRGKPYVFFFSLVIIFEETEIVHISIEQTCSENKSRNPEAYRSSRDV